MTDREHHWGFPYWQEVKESPVWDTTGLLGKPRMQPPSQGVMVAMVWLLGSHPWGEGRPPMSSILHHLLQRDHLMGSTLVPPLVPGCSCPAGFHTAWRAPALVILPTLPPEEEG